MTVHSDEIYSSRIVIRLIRLAWKSFTRLRFYVDKNALEAPMDGCEEIAAIGKVLRSQS